MKLIIVSISMLLLNISYIFSQNNGFGFKSGMTTGFQNWNGSQRDPLFAWHAAAYADSESSDGNTIYGQLGYHEKGGALRYNRFIDQFGNIYPGQTFEMKFNNLGIEVGFKRFLKVKKFQPYYAIGLRAEYTLSTKFEINEALREWVR
ncbi:MAG: hypothetical protein M3Q56_00810, partial [Bacteroidota bacterium]|nr:hypothetical protein [Bacteroidota bacterium]